MEQKNPSVSAPIIAEYSPLIFKEAILVNGKTSTKIQTSFLEQYSYLAASDLSGIINRMENRFVHF